MHEQEEITNVNNVLITNGIEKTSEDMIDLRSTAYYYTILSKDLDEIGNFPRKFFLETKNTYSSL